MISQAYWQRLLDPAQAPLRDAAGQVDATSPADVEGLRRRFDAELVSAALELARGRSKAGLKFGALASTLVADAVGIEQASSLVVADHKAKRFATAGAQEIHDLCCGIGGDAMSLARVARVIAYDADPVRAWMCKENAGCEVVCTDVTQLELDEGAFWHLDPSRRDEVSGKRSWRYEDYRPEPSFIEELLTTHPNGAVKLGPGVQLDALALRRSTEIELISEGGKLVQTVQWGGRLAKAGLRRATMLPSGESLSGQPSNPPASPGGAIDGYLFQTDPTIERAGLLGTLAAATGLVEIFPGLGLLTGASSLDSPWVTGYQVLEVLPWREKKIRKALRALDAGAVELRNRGHAVDAALVTRELQGSGSTPLIVFALRSGRRVRAVIVRRA